MQKTYKQALQYLQKLYTNGIIPYARVNNSFIKKTFFSIFPHPAIGNKNINYFKPLSIENNKIKFNQKNSLLLLNIFNFLRPSELAKKENLITNFFDKNLNFIDNLKKNEYLKKIDLLKDFLKKNNLTMKSIMEKERSFYLKNFLLKNKKKIILENENIIVMKEKKELTFSSFIDKEILNPIKTSRKLSEIIKEYKNNNILIENNIGPTNE